MSRKAPLACFHCQASHSFVDSLRRLSAGMRGDQLAYIEDVFRADLPAAVPERQPSPSSMNLFFLERKGKNVYFCAAFTRRHIGAARTRETSPAAISNCAS